LLLDFVEALDLVVVENFELELICLLHHSC